MNKIRTWLMNGYAIWDDVFDREEMSRMLAALAAADLQRTRAGAIGDRGQERPVCSTRTHPPGRSSASSRCAFNSTTRRVATARCEFFPIRIPSVYCKATRSSGWPRQIPPVDCTTPAGGVIAMRPLTIHASSKSIDDRPRRVLHVEYAQSMSLGRVSNW